jgi:hypothetical protein
MRIPSRVAGRLPRFLRRDTRERASRLVALNLPLVAGGALTIALGLALVFVMPERNFRPSPREGRSSVRHAAATARGGARLARSRPVLLILLAAVFFSGMSQEGFDRLYVKQFLDVVGLPTIGGLEPVVWFGVIGAGGLVFIYLRPGSWPAASTWAARPSPRGSCSPSISSPS